ncbi:hypothetical protein [Pseudonocardia sp. EC080619-01]|uniref:hypothetical protein n=1 Tax=Pseudonocardia sp. EC080619-01 TaxID=1096856 RepID=UPI000A4389DD|nr:hypothetical protein [Pseudonocardia sp. EC080619-01]
MIRALPRPGSIRPRPARLETKTAALADAPSAAATAGTVLAHTGAHTAGQHESPEFDLSGDPEGNRVGDRRRYRGPRRRQRHHRPGRLPDPGRAGDEGRQGPRLEPARAPPDQGRRAAAGGPAAARHARRRPDTLAARRRGTTGKGRYILGTRDGRDAYQEAKAFDTTSAYSIDYKVTPDGAKISAGTRRIYDLDVYEFSPVLHGAHRLATQMAIKSGRPDRLQVKAATGGSRIRSVLSLTTCLVCGGPASGGLGGRRADSGLVCANCLAEIDGLTDTLTPDDVHALPDFEFLEAPRLGFADPITCGLCGDIAGGAVDRIADDQEWICPDCVAAVTDLGDQLAADADTGPSGLAEYAQALRDEKPLIALPDGTLVRDQAARQGHGWAPGAGGRAQP